MALRGHAAYKADISIERPQPDPPPQSFSPAFILSTARWQAVPKAQSGFYPSASFRPEIASNFGET